MAYSKRKKKGSDDSDPEREHVQKWLNRIKLAETYQEKFGDTDGRWGRHVRAIAGDFNSKSELGEEAIDVNVTHSTLQTMLPPLWITNPYITFKPQTPRYKGRDNVQAAQYGELEINYWLRELEVRKAVKKAVLDMEATNLGYALVGYVKDKADVENDEGERVEPNPTIQYGQPFVRRISPRNVIVPSGYEDVEDAPWIAIKWTKRMDDVKDRYGEKAKDIKPSRSSSPFKPNESTSKELSEYINSEDCQLVDIYEVWNKRDETVCTVADGCEHYLNEGAWPYEVDGFPVVQMRAVDVPDEYYGTPPMQYYYPQQKELNAARTSLRKRFNRSKSVVIASGDLSDEFKEAYQKAQDGEMLTSGLPGDNPIGNNMLPIPPPPPDPNVMLYEDRIQTDIRQISGLGAEQRGAGDPNIDSATASANVEKWALVRSSDLGDRVRSFYLGIARKLWMILKQHPNEKRTRLIAGDRAGMFTEVSYSLKDIDGEFDFEMDLSSMMADNPSERLKLSLANYNMMRADPAVNPEALILDVFRAQNKPNPESYVMFLRSPQEEIQLMVQGLPVEAHDRDDHEGHVAAHHAQITDIESNMMTASSVQPEFGSSPTGEKLRYTLALLLAHINDHTRRIQQISGKAGGRGAGSAVAKNSLRAQTKEATGGETRAEMAGQPLTEQAGYEM